jgi:predicted N-acyltransferase
VQIKKERRSIYEESRLRLEVLQGDAIPDAYFDDDTIFKVYISTIEKLFWGCVVRQEAALAWPTYTRTRQAYADWSVGSAGGST